MVSGNRMVARIYRLFTRGINLMPNWCANRVTVFGDEEEVREFKEFVNISPNIIAPAFKSF